MTAGGRRAPGARLPDGHHRALVADQPFDFSTLVFHLLTTDVVTRAPSVSTGPMVLMSGWRSRCSPGRSRKLWRGRCGPGAAPRVHVDPPCRRRQPKCVPRAARRRVSSGPSRPLSSRVHGSQPGPVSSKRPVLPFECDHAVGRPPAPPSRAPWRSAVTSEPGPAACPSPSPRWEREQHLPRGEAAERCLVQRAESRAGEAVSQSVCVSWAQ